MEDLLAQWIGHFMRSETADQLYAAVHDAGTTELEQELVKKTRAGGPWRAFTHMRGLNDMRAAAHAYRNATPNEFSEYQRIGAANTESAKKGVPKGQTSFGTENSVATKKLRRPFWVLRLLVWASLRMWIPPLSAYKIYWTLPTLCPGLEMQLHNKSNQRTTRL